MSNNRIVFNGLAELRAALRNLPADLASDATDIVDQSAAGARDEMLGEYVGSLRTGLTLTRVDQGKYSAGAILKNRSPLAWLWDNGSEARHYVTSRGNTHATGAMWGRRPPPHTFAKAMAKARRQMYQRLKDLLVRHGLRVSGEP